MRYLWSQVASLSVEAQQSITLFTRWHDANSLEDMNLPRARLLLQGSDTMWFGANQLKHTASFPSKQAIPSHHHDHHADVNYHAFELIHIMCKGKIWFGRLKAYQLASGMLHDTRVIVPPSLPITIKTKVIDKVTTYSIYCIEPQHITLTNPTWSQSLLEK